MVEPIETTVFSEFKTLTSDWLDHPNKYNQESQKYNLEVRQHNKTIKMNKNWTTIDTSQLMTTLRVTSGKCE